MLNSDTASLNLIEYGSVIDHIPDRHALKVVRLLNLDRYDNRVSIGLHLPSPTVGRKEMIKIEGWQLNPEEANAVAILAPDATISLVKDFVVERKFQVSPPDNITRILTCPNADCITNFEECETRFSVNQMRKTILLQCHYCQREYQQAEITSYNT